MTTIGDQLGDIADKVAQRAIKVGDVHILALDESNGITPKDGNATRNKFFIVLGFDSSGNVIGGLVINSKINLNLPSTVTDYQFPITVQQCPFLSHDSFVNCSKLIRAEVKKFGKATYKGAICDKELMKQIVETVKESPTANKKMLKDFGIL
ncbi:MAG: hypothetical protein Q4D41_10680 [Prevotellaceae bacterium]|nr:hypothetical protein [Prevotellaceae bacterium]